MLEASHSAIGRGSRAGNEQPHPGEPSSAAQTLSSPVLLPGPDTVLWTLASLLTALSRAGHGRGLLMQSTWKTSSALRGSQAPLAPATRDKGQATSRAADTQEATLTVEKTVRRE